MFCIKNDPNQNPQNLWKFDDEFVFYRYSKCFGFYHGKSPWNHHVFFSNHLKPIWVKVAMTSAVWWCFLRLVFRDTTKVEKALKLSELFLQNHDPDRAHRISDFTINRNVNKHVRSIQQKFMVKWWRHVLLHVFATRKTQPKSLEVPRIDGGCVCHELSREEYFLGRVINANSTVLSLFWRDRDPVKFITIVPPPFGRICLTTFSKSCKVQESWILLFFYPSHGRHDFWSPAWDVMD